MRVRSTQTICQTALILATDTLIIPSRDVDNCPREWGMSSIATAGTASNVVQIFRGPARPRVVDPELAAYLKDVNTEMFEQTGVHYLALREDLHGDGFDAVRSYMDRGVDASAAVDDFIRDHGLRRVEDDFTAEQAAAYNRAKAAISAFVGSAGDWHRAGGGQVYRRLDDGVAFMFPVPYRKDSPNEQEQCGFGIDYREGAVVNEYTHQVDVEGESVARMRRSDIEDALVALDACIVNRLENGKFAY